MLLLKLEDFKERLSRATSDTEKFSPIIHWSDVALIQETLSELRRQEVILGHVNSALLVAVAIAQGKSQ